MRLGLRPSQVRSASADVDNDFDNHFPIDETG